MGNCMNAYIVVGVEW